MDALKNSINLNYLSLAVSENGIGTKGAIEIGNYLKRLEGIKEFHFYAYDDGIEESGFLNLIEGIAKANELNNISLNVAVNG